MKTKKSGVFAALAAALLLTAVLVSNCTDPISPDGIKIPKEKPSNFQPPPEGKGYVRLNFGSSNGRTIMPTYANIAAANFAAFVVNMTNKDHAGQNNTTNRTFSGATPLADLTAYDFLVTAGDEYTIKVDAYLDFTGGIGTAIIAATWTDDIEMEATGTVTDVEVELAAIKTGSGTGIFKWNLQYDSGPFTVLGTTGTATMDFTIIAGGASASQINLKTTPVNTTTGVSMTAGEYRISVALASEKDIDIDDEEYQSETRTWVLHIYQGMESVFAEDLTPLRSIAHEVTFENDDGDDGDTSVIYRHSELLTNVTRYPYLSSGGTLAPIPPVHIDGTSGFVGWYTEDGSGLTPPWDGLSPVDLSTYRVFYPQTLVARWAEADKANVTVTFSLSDPGNALTLTSAASISVADFISSGLTLAVNTVSGATYSWKYDGNTVGTATATITILYTDDVTGWGYIEPGTHTFSLEIVLAGTTYDKQFAIEVTAP